VLIETLRALKMSRVVKLPFQKAATTYRNNADKMVPTAVDIHSSDRDQQIKSIIQTVCPFLSESNLDIEPLGGGLSNDLFVVDQQVLVRIHPTADDGCSVVDRDVETKMAAWLADQKMAPILYGRFQNGRVEEFYPNVAPLSCHDMPKYSAEIGTILAKFHTSDMPESILPKPTTDHSKNSYPFSHLNVINHWLQIAKSKRKHISGASDSDFVTTVETEWSWLKQELLAENMPPKHQDNNLSQNSLNFIRQVVFTHMDCQSLNLLRVKDTAAAPPESIKLIDFEYAGWNPRAADLANTFCEFCDMNNICAKYEVEYPSVETQNAFLMAYLKEANPNWFASVEDDEQALLENVLPVLRHEVGRFTLLSHVGWTVWSLVKDQDTSGIEFDYIKYAHHRMDGYRLFKSWFFD
jgi:thiamine kinase-like enzyme